MPWNCPWSQERQRPPAAIPPLHYEKEGVAQAHAFRSKSFRKPQPCHWCHQPVAGQGSCCRVCKYVCHTSCENMVSLD
ncbi:SH3 and cysteine-rich domain-containing protein 2-like isoform X3 [Cydia pomonella]|uniref:SH3 and cysteine-rich domain-containing protein 2-like isoform X3 n=1 Tax=Cydia pomonella TaxID=82600 RepID=UPI002ADDD612|nr:SH3 and cysteine-rich domain-containing protein 2-like isoform X3 [Cydia pomonella]